MTDLEVFCSVLDLCGVSWRRKITKRNVIVRGDGWGYRFSFTDPEIRRYDYAPAKAAKAPPPPRTCRRCKKQPGPDGWTTGGTCYCDACREWMHTKPRPPQHHQQTPEARERARQQALERPLRASTCAGCGSAYDSRSPIRWCPRCARIASKISARKYPIDIPGFWALHRAQGGACAICREPERARRFLSIDHCHKTGRVRGLLCVRCNLGIGHFADHPERILRAADYVSRQSDSEVPRA